jgi:hypothetical protein
MNKIALDILNRTLRDKLPFIRRIWFQNWNNHFDLSRIIAHVDMDLYDLSQMFPDERIDQDYLEKVEYIISNPYHIFEDFREDDPSIDNLIKALSRSVGVDVYEIKYHVSH